MTEEVQIINEIEKAAALCEKKYTHDEIISVMNTENDFEKQICILKLKYLKSLQEANLLVFQLTGHHGLIREATASKINEFITEGRYLNFFLNETCLDSFLQAINDINPNICRLICGILNPLFRDNHKEKQEFLNALYIRLDKIFEELETLKRSRFYTKKLFNLYWSLEALAILEPQIDNRLEATLSKAASIRDYTIREKAAAILGALKNTSLETEQIKEKLKNDENFYVKRYSQSF